MNYKYYIYKQFNLTADFDKYDLNDYSLFREIQQNSQWGLKPERDKEFFTIIRKKFSGAITVKGDDFDSLISIERDTKQYAIVIHQECSGVWSEFWKGYFSYFDFKVDLDRCYLTFEPEVWDEYSPVFDQMPIERNVLAADTGQSVFSQGYEWPFEQQVTVIDLIGSYPAVASFIEDPAHPGEEYYLYSQITTFIGYREVVGVMRKIYSIETIYKREVSYAAVIPPGTNWINIETVSPGYYKWVRRIGDGLATTYITTWSGLNKSEILDYNPGETEVWNGCIYLSSVIEYFMLFTDLTYTSNFFNDTPCPMGGNTLVRTMIQQISNVRDTADVATKGLMTLKWLLTHIRDTFNVFPYIDSGGDFRLEHRKYFEWGLSYSVIPAITLDLSAYPGTYKLSRYEWLKPELFRWEKLEIPYSYFPDWLDSSIEYTQFSVSGNETKTTSVEWATDLIALKNFNADLPKKGWVLLNVELVMSHGIGTNNVISAVGALSCASFPNARFSQANLFRDLWTWGRLLPTGLVNGAPTNFDSIERLKKQVELNIPQCCDVIDYNGIFRTALGDGLLDTAEYESKSGNLKINLIYE